MKKSILSLVAVVLLAAGSTFAASTFTGVIQASAFLNNGTVAVAVSLDDANIDCGTLDYTAINPLAANTPCPSGPGISTAHASVTNNDAFVPFYITLISQTALTRDQVILTGPQNTRFPLLLSVEIDSAAYTTGSYYHPTSATSDILITPVTGAVASGQPAGRYTGGVTFFLSF